jgi:nucleotide-binding universal stress UspA family protein
MYRTLLVPLDGSAFAEHALPAALAIARRCRAGIHRHFHGSIADKVVRGAHRPVLVHRPVQA